MLERILAAIEQVVDSSGPSSPLPSPLTGD